jgi:hypothetical protein
MVTVFVGLSLVCSYILFKVLKSSATVKKPRVQLGGAIAGFLVILGLVLQVFNVWYQKETQIKKIIEEANKKAEGKWKPEIWTICARRVVKGNSSQENNGNQGGIIGRLMPPPMAETESNGYFRLENVLKWGEEPWPDLMFEYEGYHPTIVDRIDKWITEKNTDEVEIDMKKRKITLLKDINLIIKGGNE